MSGKGCIPCHHAQLQGQTGARKLPSLPASSLLKLLGGSRTTQASFPSYQNSECQELCVPAFLEATSFRDAQTGQTAFVLFLPLCTPALHSLYSGANPRCPSLISQE